MYNSYYSEKMSDLKKNFFDLNNLNLLSIKIAFLGPGKYKKKQSYEFW